MRRHLKAIFIGPGQPRRQTVIDGDSQTLAYWRLKILLTGRMQTEVVEEQLLVLAVHTYVKLAVNFLEMLALDKISLGRIKAL